MRKSFRRKKSLGSKFRGFIRQGLSRCLPKKIRFAIYRRTVRARSQALTDVKFKIAETQDELCQAFRLLHNAYVTSGFMDPHESGMRITKYHSLPTTTTLIAVKNEQVIATVSLIRSSIFGLPCESAYDLSPLKRRRGRITEVSALAIDPAHGQDGSDIFWHLLTFLYRYAVQFFGTDYLVAITSPRWFEFYEAVLFFKPFSRTKFKYDFVKGAPGMGGCLTLRHVPTIYELTYGDKPEGSNLHHLMVERSFENFCFPKRRPAAIADPVMTPAMIDYFFNKVTTVFRDLTASEAVALHRLYNAKSYASVLPPRPQPSDDFGRAYCRFDVNCFGHLHVTGTSDVTLLLKNLSQVGICGIMHRSLRCNENYRLSVFLHNGEVAELQVSLIWAMEDGTCGFNIFEASTNWAAFVKGLEANILKSNPGRQVA